MVDRVSYRSLRSVVRLNTRKRNIWLTCALVVALVDLVFFACTVLLVFGVTIIWWICSRKTQLYIHDLETGSLHWSSSCLASRAADFVDDLTYKTYLTPSHKLDEVIWSRCLLHCAHTFIRYANRATKVTSQKLPIDRWWEFSVGMRRRVSRSVAVPLSLRSHYLCSKIALLFKIIQFADYLGTEKTSIKVLSLLYFRRWMVALSELSTWRVLGSCVSLFFLRVRVWVELHRDRLRLQTQHRTADRNGKTQK